MDVALQKRDSNDLNEEEKHEIYIQEMKRWITCPKCEGKGGWGPLGPCTFMSAHWEKPCPCCNGFKQTWRSKKCLLCKGRGGLGSLGPTEIGDIHFLKECDVCGGAGFVR